MKAIAIAAAALLALASAACNTRPDCEGHYHFHTSFPESLKASAHKGVDAWNKFSDNQVTLDDTVSDDTTCSFKDVPLHSQEYQDLKSNEAGGVDWNGISLGPDSAVNFCTENWGDQPTEYAQYVTMHEIGHTWGMKHVHNDEHAIMAPDSPILRLEYNQTDKVECAARWAGCKY
jgi:hypothetical protein